MQIKLVITNMATGTVQSVDSALDETVVLGRGPSSPVQLEGSLISREHFALTNSDGRIRIRDLSSNGTSFKNERLSRDSQVEIKDGDSIFVPGYRVEFRIPEQEPQEAPHPAPSGLVEEREPKWPWLKPVHDFLDSFSRLELFLSLAALCCFCLVLFYVLS